MYNHSHSWFAMKAILFLAICVVTIWARHHHTRSHQKGRRFLDKCLKVLNDYDTMVKQRESYWITEERNKIYRSRIYYDLTTFLERLKRKSPLRRSSEHKRQIAKATKLIAAFKRRKLNRIYVPGGVPTIVPVVPQIVPVYPGGVVPYPPGVVEPVEIDITAKGSVVKKIDPDDND